MASDQRFQAAASYSLTLLCVSSGHRGVGGGCHGGGEGAVELAGDVNRPGFGGDSSVESQATRLVRSPSSYRASNSAGGLPPQAP